MSFRICARGRTIVMALLASAVLSSTGFAVDSRAPEKSTSVESLPPNIKQIIHHGQVLGRPALQPENTKGAVAYELGRLLQLDRDHCLLVASMDEQGGGDLCVGNDCFVIQKLSEVAAEKAIPLNRAARDYTVAPGAEKTFLAKYPAVGMFVPLGAHSVACNVKRSRS